MKLTCDYCMNRYDAGDGAYSEDGDFCSMECVELEQVDRSELVYDMSREEDLEFRTDMAIDLEREKDL